MSEAQRFGLVKSLVQIEAKLVNANIGAYGSLYYRDDCPDGWDVADPALSLSSNNWMKGALAKFVLGPITERSFWADERRDLECDRGPCTFDPGTWKTSPVTLRRRRTDWILAFAGRTAEDYITTVVNWEIACIRANATGKDGDSSLLAGTVSATPEKHIRLLEQFLTVLPHILPPEEINYPVLLHHDLHADNIFVDEADPTKISDIIDWQAVYAAPLFLQARFPSLVDCDDPYPWGAVQPELPEDFDTLSPAEKEAAKEELDRVRLKKFYEIASRKFNPAIFRAMDAMRNDDDPTAFIFHIIGQSSSDGPVPLRELLIQIYEKWDGITEKTGSRAPCPISFTEEEIKQARQQAQAWADVYNEFDRLRTEIVGKDGWVSHEDYEDALRRFNSHKETLEKLGKQLSEVARLM